MTSKDYLSLFGSGYITWAQMNFGGYSLSNAQIFSQEQARIHGTDGYGDINYVDNVLRYYAYSNGISGSGGWLYPLPKEYPITSEFGNRKHPITGEANSHGGTDFGAPEGTPVLASKGGEVVVANSTNSWGEGWGYYVKIKHDDTYHTLYAHCSSVVVKVGDTVRQGQTIAYTGNTGDSSGPHLHFEIYQKGVRINPMQFFPKKSAEVVGGGPI